MKTYIRSSETLEDYILSPSYISEIEEDAYKLITKLDQVDDAYVEKYGRPNTHIQEIIRTIESSIDRIDTILRSKLVSATNAYSIPNNI